MVARFNAVVHRRARASSGVTGWRPLALAAAALLASRGAAAATDAASDDFTIVEIRSDDSSETAATFLRTTLRVLSESKIRLRFRGAGTLLGSEGITAASFITDEDGIALQLASPAAELSIRRIPWLADAHQPLRKTLALGKGNALALLLESLTADAQAVRLRPLPTPPAQGRSTTSAPRTGVVDSPGPPPAPAPSSSVEPARSGPTDRLVPSPEATDGAPATTAPLRAEHPPATRIPAAAAVLDAAAPPRAAAASNSPPQIQTKRGSTGAELEVDLPLAGVAWTPPATIAPQIEAAVGWGGPRFWAVVDLALQLDSNFAIDGRSFGTAGYEVRVGLRRTWLRSERFRWDAEATAVCHLNRYRRDDIAGAETHSWLDLGAGVHSRAGLRVSRRASVLWALGLEAFPTARLASIANGPSRRVNLLTLSAVAGLAFDF